MIQNWFRSEWLETPEFTLTPQLTEVISKHRLQNHSVYGALKTTGSNSIGPEWCLLQLHPSCSSTLKPHTTTHMDIVSIFHGRGALKSTGLGISALCSLHYSLPSHVAELICVDKGLDGKIVIRSALLTFNYFYPRCRISATGMTPLLHFHVESFMQLKTTSWPLPKSVPRTHQLHIHCSC